jgi:hypothetical protein
MNGGPLTGPGYTLELPPGFTVVQSFPPMGMYRLLPPGSTPMDMEAMVQIRSVPPFQLPQLLQSMYGSQNPWVAQMSAQGLGIAQVTGTLPARQVQLPQGTGHILEFEGLTMFGFPVRVMVIAVEGMQAAVEIDVMMNLYRWTEFASPCLSILTQVTLAGMAPAQAQLQAVVDEQRTDQVEYQVVAPGQQPIPLTALPTNVGGTTVIHVDTLIQTGDIQGTGITVGSHSVSTVGATT